MQARRSSELVHDLKEIAPVLIDMFVLLHFKGKAFTIRTKQFEVVTHIFVVMVALDFPYRELLILFL